MNKEETREKALKSKITSSIEVILDDLIEFDNTGKSCYNTGDIANKVFKLRELWRMYSETY